MPNTRTPSRSSAWGANDGLGDVYRKIAALLEAERKAFEVDIIDNSMPTAIRGGGKMWNVHDKEHELSATIPDRGYACVFDEVVEFCKKNGAFDPKTMHQYLPRFFRCPLESEDPAEERVQQVFVCLDLARVPDSALPVPGELVASGADSREVSTELCNAAGACAAARVPAEQMRACYGAPRAYSEASPSSHGPRTTTSGGRVCRRRSSSASRSWAAASSSGCARAP